MNSSVLDLDEELRQLTLLKQDLEVVKVAKRPDFKQWQAAWRARERWDPRWQRALIAYMSQQLPFAPGDLDDLIAEGEAAWGRGRLRKRKGQPSALRVVQFLRDFIDPTAWLRGAMSVYLGLAIDTSEEAGQFTLDALGIDETFAWASPRDFVRDPFAVHGSKILQGVYGSHIDKLAQVVIDATDPAAPKTIGDVQRHVKNEWSKLTTAHARTIARTEVANVWEHTNFNAMALNGVEQFDWLIASGPSIGPPKSYPVCEHCLLMQVKSPIAKDDIETLAPLHPNCRCTLVHHLTDDWLPPAEPWTGGTTDMAVFL